MFTCCESVLSSNAMYQVKNVFIPVENLASFIISCYLRDIHTLKQRFHPWIKELQLKQNKKKNNTPENYQSMACFFFILSSG